MIEHQQIFPTNLFLIDHFIPMSTESERSVLYNMKNYMVTHTFKSAEMKAKFTETVASMKMEDIVKSMKSDNAACQMTWNTPGDTMEMFCWWKGKDEQAIINQLGQMNDFFTPHKFVECTDDIIDFNAK